MSNPQNLSVGLDAAMKAMEHVKPCNTFVTPVPDGYEMDADGSTLLAVDPRGVKPTMYFSFSARVRGWHPYSTGFAPAVALPVPAPPPKNK